MDKSSLAQYLKRQKTIDKSLKGLSQKSIKEVTADQKRLKGASAEEVAAIWQKYSKTKPQMAELKRMLSDCLYKLLSFFQYGNEGLWFDTTTGEPLMKKMWAEFGSSYIRPTRAQLIKYIADFEANCMDWGCAEPLEANAKPRLIEEVITVTRQLLSVYDCCSSEGNKTPQEMDAVMNSTIEKIWAAWHRDRKHLAMPHTDSFDYFLNHGLQSVIRDINNNGEFVHRKLDTGVTVMAHIVPESVRIHPPEGTPQQARTTGSSYCGKVTCKVYVTILTEQGEQALDFAYFMSHQDVERIHEMNVWLEEHRFVPKGSAAVATDLLWDDVEFPLYLGEIPIMVGSSHCMLRDMTPEQKVAIEEDGDEIGGFFIVNGNERIVRLMVHSRANYPLAIERGTFARRGEMLSPKAILVRSCQPTGVYYPNSLLYEETGVAIFSFLRRRHWLVPVAQLLLALKPVTFHSLYHHFLPAARSEVDGIGAQASHERAANNVQVAWILAKQSAGGDGSTFDWTAHLGNYFRPFYERWLPNVASCSPTYIGEYVIRRHVLPHLNSDTPLVPGTHREEKERKFYYLLHMVRKLFDYVDGYIGTDSSDQTAHQQVVTPGESIAALCQQNFFSLYREVESRIAKRASKAGNTDPEENTYDNMAAKMLHIFSQFDRNVFGQVNLLIATGNFAASQQRSFGIMQNSGLSIIAERINLYRLLSQIRSVHRGSAIAEMRSSIARKLPLEAWGFLCPVETPDGAPCGVLNHLTAACVVSANLSNEREVRETLIQALIHRGMRPVNLCAPQETLLLVPVTLNGEMLGYIDPSQLDNDKDDNIGTWLRSLKSDASAAKVGILPLPQTLEICCIPIPSCTSEQDRQQLEKKGMLPLYPGLLLFTTAGRFMRPIRSLLTGNVEYVGALEQVYLHVACTARDLAEVPRPEDRKLYRHIETSPGAILSLVSSLIPFFAHNPSPRNLFQCQMAKQTMGVYSLAYRQRFDNKVYELRTPQRPLVRTEQYWGWGMDSHPITTNAIVAIISYAEYDMEDAVVINRASLERGMFAADVVKSFPLDLNQALKSKTPGWSAKTATRYRCFRRKNDGSKSKGDGNCIDESGLPRIGAELRCGCHYFATCEVYLSKNPDYSPDGEGQAAMPILKDFVNFKEGSYMKGDRCYVEAVKPVETTDDGDILAVMVRVRLVRDPVLGDKFSSQHGQKGTMSLLLAEADMPFSDSGMVPDLLINPHAFPSRMTVGMMLELLAGKVGALTGRFIVHEASAWSGEYSTKDTHRLLGEQLSKLGFDYYGDETLYSGETGEELKARIFMGCCAYQRLRHMVMDKWQCREKVGPIDITTLQPVKGRKVGGGIKVGEMERDALLSHGCVNLVTDRLFSHGLTNVPVCKGCGSFLTLIRKSVSLGTWDENFEGDDAVRQEKITCSQCPCKEYRIVGLPFAFIYLCAELLALNMELCLDLKPDPVTT